MEDECGRLQSALGAERHRADSLASQLSSQQKADRRGTLIVKCEIETKHQQRDARFSALQDQLDQVGLPAIDLYSIRITMETCIILFLVDLFALI